MSAVPVPSVAPAKSPGRRAGGWLGIASRKHAAGDRDGADRAYAMYLHEDAPRDPLLLRAGLALSENRIPEAEALLRDRLRQLPEDVAALRMLAELAARISRDQDAVNLLERCVELAPGFHAARQQYALMLNRAEKPSEALAQIELLLGRDPANPAYRNLKAVILCHVGEYDAAIAIYDELLARYPRQPKMWLSCGHALKTAGYQDRAIAAYRRAIELEPGFGEGWWSLANLKTFRFEDTEVATMQAQLARGEELGPQERHHFGFALGKALEDRGQYEQSFRHYLDGNTLRRATVIYNAEDNSLRVRRTKQLLDAEFFRKREGYGAQGADPIFVLGLPRAGSTLIEQILSSHSQVEGTMELPEIIGLTRGLRRLSETPRSSGYLEVLAGQDAAELQELGERYLQRTRIHRHTDAPFFIDKMPNNFQHIGLIRLALPNAKIIDARRHPLACCLSAFKQHFARGQNFSYDLGELGRYYCDYVELMAHYDAVLPGRIHRVFYESMVDDTETEVRRLLDYCGLPFEDGCLRFYENERAVRTASSEQVRKPIYRDGVDHFRHYEQWLGPLRQALGEVLERYPEVPEFRGTGS